jgi:wyosine [tRNA(Phe)-imidazoG37] synthetase (radical SAM superfamily)
MGYIYGPVPSRRLGRSLGIDLVPFKACTYDCIYCQLGRTTNKTIERREWSPPDEIIDALPDNLGRDPDYITLSGSGEPTLYSRIGDLIERVHSLTDIPVAVLTNGSLLWKKELRRQIEGADLVIPSLDAGDGRMFRAVNRPHPEITFEKMLEGLISFREEFRGACWLEVFILAGHTAIEEEARKLANCVDRIKPDRVQLNTVTRPPAEDYAVSAGRARLEELAALFNPRAEVIAEYSGVYGEYDFAATEESVLQLLRRRPCTIEDISGGLGIHRNEAIKYAEKLLEKELAEFIRESGRAYLRARQG